MKSLKEHINRTLELFYASVDNDIVAWKNITSGIKIHYDNAYFKFHKNELRLYIYSNYAENYMILSKYKIWFIPTNLKVYVYKIKLKKHFSKIEKEKKRLKSKNKNNNKRNMLKSGITIVESKYSLAIRKEKLKKLKNG